MPEHISIKIMRHAPTAWNLEGKMQGNVDIPIVGEKVYEYFKEIAAQTLSQPEVILVSGLIRTKQTADALKRRNGWESLPVFTHTELNERKWGILEGKTRDDVYMLLIGNRTLVEKYPELIDRERFVDILDRDEFFVEGGESIRQVRERVEKVLKQIPDIYPHENFLIVTHAGVMVSMGLDFHKISSVSLVKRKGKWGIKHG